VSLLDRAITLLGSPVPLRTQVVRKLLRLLPVGSFSARLDACAFDRPSHAFCLYNAALEAKALGHTAFTAIEFGVAGGNGLMLLCQYRDEIQRELGLTIHLIGFDAGSGLPPSTDPRDLLYTWPPGSFQMDVPKLQARLAGRVQLILGNVAETTRTLTLPADAPLGAVIFDLDYYTSTRDALTIFDQANVLPRVWCYFDDVEGTASNALTDHLGERAAIAEFNSTRNPLDAHLALAYAFKFVPPEPWHPRIFVYHRPSHPDYNRCLATEPHTLALKK